MILCWSATLQEPQTKVWLYYGAETWGPSLNKENNWKYLERHYSDHWSVSNSFGSFLREGTQGASVIETTCWRWRYSLLVCWNPTVVQVTWHKHKCTTPFYYILDSPHLNTSTPLIWRYTYPMYLNYKEKRIRLYHSFTKKETLMSLDALVCTSLE